MTLKKLEKYQEQPQLMDPHLPLIIKTLMNKLEIYLHEKYENENPLVETETNLESNLMTESDAAMIFNIIYITAKVRGYKVISRLFPHSINNLLSTFQYLIHIREKMKASTYNPTSDKKSFDQQQFWKISYVLLLWLAVIVLIPFNLNAFEFEIKTSLPSRIVLISKEILSEASIDSEASSELLSNLFQRPDLALDLKDFVQDSLTIVSQYSLLSQNQSLSPHEIYHTTGILRTIVRIFQKSNRESLQEFVPKIMKVFFGQQQVFDEQVSILFTLQKKLSVKLFQRMALALLKPKVPKWRYVQKRVSLLDNLSQNISKNFLPQNISKPQIDANKENDNVQTSEEEDYDIPDEIETFLSILISSLKDRDTDVRWSAAKGIARLTSRLPLLLADDVIGTLLDLFDESETESAWHGACLCIAELSRRGLLLPTRLAELEPKLKLALHYELIKGQYCSGTNVRDAACYVAWSLARAYDPDLLLPLCQGLSIALLINSLFDKEVNIRRSASAAFQEHVGRHGNFPHGIQIISLVNFFSVSNIKNCFLNLLPQIYTFQEYRKPLLDHLAYQKNYHIDIHIRQLAALSLSKLISYNIDYFVSDIIPHLITSSCDLNFVKRHGGLLALAHILNGFFKLQQNGTKNNKPSNSYFPQNLENKIKNIPFEIERSRLYRGKGSEYIRMAVSNLIQSIVQLEFSFESNSTRSIPAESRLHSIVKKEQKEPNSLNQYNILKFYLKAMEENLKHPKESVVFSSVSCLSLIVSNHISNKNVSEDLNKMIKIWIDGTSDQSQPLSARKGYTLALGALHPSIMGINFNSIIITLLEITKTEKKRLNDIELRRSAVMALAQIILHIPSSYFKDPSEIWNPKKLKMIIQSFLNSINDYTIDHRGDIGSILREASMVCLYLVIQTISTVSFELSRPFNEFNPSSFNSIFFQWIDSKQTDNFVCLIIKQCLEKIDRTRDLAGTILESLLISSGTYNKNTPKIQEDPNEDFNSSGVYYSSYNPEKSSILTDITIPDIVPHSALISENLKNISNGKDSISVITHDFNWSSPKLVFNLLIPLLEFEIYQYWIIYGLIRSIGGMHNNQELVEDSSRALLHYLDNHNQVSFISQIGEQFLKILKINHGRESVLVPLWKTLGILFDSGFLYNLHPTKYLFPETLLEETKKEIELSPTISKINSSISIFASLLGYNQDESQSLRISSLIFMITLLGSKYPVIRKNTAEVLFLQLEANSPMLCPQNPSSNNKVLEKAKSILSSTFWKSDDGQISIEMLKSLWLIKGE